MTQLEECRKAIEPICMRQNDCWYDTKTIATAVYVILIHMIDADRKTENGSENPNNCESSGWCNNCNGKPKGLDALPKKDESQTEGDFTDGTDFCSFAEPKKEK